MDDIVHATEDHIASALDSNDTKVSAYFNFLQVWQVGERSVD